MAAKEWNPERAAGLVEDGWALAEATANNSIASLNDYINAIKNAGLSIDLDDINVDLDPPTTTIPDLAVPATDLTAPDLTIVQPDMPASPTLVDIDPIEPGDVPEFLATYPVINLPEKPIVVKPTDPGEAPTVTDPILPDNPEYTIPNVPTLRDINLPDVPDVSDYSFDEVIPEEGDLPAPPANRDFIWDEEKYTSELLVAYTESLLNDINNGRSGLPEWVEQQFYDRLRNRTEESNLAQKQAAYDEFAARGFDLPPGALAARIDKIEKDSADRNAAAAREVYINQAERVIQQMQFAVTSAIQSEGQLITYTGFYMQRALDAAKYVIDAGINIYNAQVAAFQLRLTRYQAAADVFKTLVEADLSRLELYKAQLEGQRLKGELNVQDIQIYTAQIDAIKAIVDVYRTEVDAVKTEVEIDAVKIEGFKAGVDAYKAKVDANIAEYQAYSEEIRGELAKVQLYGEEVNAYKTQVDGFQSLVQALSAQSNADIQANRAKIDRFTALIDGYKAELSGELARIDTESRAYDALVRSFTAELSGEQTKITAAVEKYRAEVGFSEAEGRLRLAQAEANIQAALNEANFAKDAYDAGARAYSALASASLSAVNLGASIGESVSESASYDWSGNFASDIDPITIKP